MTYAVTTGRWWPRLLVVLGVLTTLVATAAAGASAHPFGEPEKAEISLTAADTVRVHWEAGMVDDYTYLAQALGVLPADREMLDGVITPAVGDSYLVGSARSFPAYLRRHITVTSGRRRCEGVVQPIRQLASRGVDIDFRCPDAVTSASVSITVLSDLSELYKTIATGPGEQREVYAGSVSTHEWTFDGPVAATHTSSASHRPATPSATHHADHAVAHPAVLAVGVLVLLGASVFVVTTRRRRRLGLLTPARAPPLPHS